MNPSWQVTKLMECHGARPEYMQAQPHPVGFLGLQHGIHIIEIHNTPGGNIREDQAGTVGAGGRKQMFRIGGT